MPARTSNPLTLHLSESSLASRMAPVRRRVAEWATAQGLPSDDVDDLVLATHEALANVADHAYPEGHPEAWLDARHPTPDTLVVTVRDGGQWRTPPVDPGFRGHGMAIIRGLAERVEVHRYAVGTTVAMYWSLPQI